MYRCPRQRLLKGEASVLTFERDSTSKVVRFVLHLNGGDLVGVKVS